MDPSQGKTESSNGREPALAWPSAAPVEETVEWIVTLKPASGLIVKIEKLHRDSGARQELSSEEYGTLAALGIPVRAPGLPASAEAPPATDTLQAYYQAYYRGVYDYAQYLAGLYQQPADSSLSSPSEDPIEAQRLILANYAATNASPRAGTGS